MIEGLNGSADQGGMKIIIHGHVRRFLLVCIIGEALFFSWLHTTVQYLYSSVRYRDAVRNGAQQCFSFRVSILQEAVTIDVICFSVIYSCES